MLVAPNHVLVLCVLRKDFQKDLLHNLPRDWGYAEWPELQLCSLCFFMHGLYSSHKACRCFHLLYTSFSCSSPVRSSMLTLASPLPCFLTSCTGEWNVLVLWWSCLEDQRAVLDTSTLQGSFQWENTEAKICPSEVQLCNSVLNLDHSLRILNSTITWLLQTRLPCPLHLNHLLLQSRKSKLIFNRLENTCLLLSLFSQ